MTAAIQLARALQVTVESLFAESERHERPYLPVLAEQSATAGTPVRIGRVADHLVAAPQANDDWSPADGAIAAEGAVQAWDVPEGLVVAGCDPALNIAAGMLTKHRLVAIAATSGQARRALEDGRCHAALVHGPRPQAQSGITRFRFARWRAGIAYDPSLGRPSLDALLDDVPLVRRAKTAATQQAVERAARRLGARTPQGPVAASHVEAAHRAQWTNAAAVTIEPVANRMGLAFHDLEEHTVELWVDDRWRDHAGLEALTDLLGARAFRDRLAAMPGYDLTGSGAAA